MYQVEAANSAWVRFYMPCRILDVFVCACILGGRWHRHTINFYQGAIYHRGQIALGSFFYRKHFVFVGLMSQVDFLLGGLWYGGFCLGTLCRVLIT